MHLAKAKKNTAMKHTAKAKTHEKEVTQQQQISTDQMSGFAVKFAALSTNTNDDSPSKSIVKHSENRLPSYLINRGRTKSSQPSTILSQSSDPTQRISTNIINSSNTAQSIPPPLSFHHRYDYHDPIFKKADKPLHQYLSPNNFPYYPILSSDQMANKKIVYHDTCMGIKHKYITSNAWNLHLNTPHNHPCANAPHCPLQFVEQWHVQKHIPLCKASPLLKAIREGKKQFKFPPYIEPNEPQFMCYPGNPISIPFPNLHTQQHAHPKAQCISNSTRAIDTMSNPLLTPFISQAHSLSNTAQSIPPSIPTKGSATQQKRRKARKLKRIEKKKHKKKKHKKQSTNTTTTHTKKKKSNTKKKKDKKHKKKKKHKKQSTNTTTTHTKKKKSNTKKKKDKKHKKKKKHKKQSTNTTTTHNKKTKPKQTRKALVPAVKIRICQRILAHPDYRKMGPKRLCLNDPEYHGNGSNIYSWIREYESTGTIESRKKRGGRRSDTQDIELEIVKRLMNRNGNKRISNTDISDAAKDIDKNQKHCTYSSGWIFKMKERCRTGKHGAIGIEFAKLFDN
eukprot:660833_1